MIQELPLKRDGDLWNSYEQLPAPETLGKM